MLDNEITCTAYEEAQARCELEAEELYCKKPFPKFKTYRECKSACDTAQKNDRRYGQNVCSYYNLPEDLNQLLWPNNSAISVHLFIFNYFKGNSNENTQTRTHMDNTRNNSAFQR